MRTAAHAQMCSIGIINEFNEFNDKVNHHLIIYWSLRLRNIWKLTIIHASVVNNQHDDASSSPTHMHEWHQFADNTWKGTHKAEDDDDAY